MKKCYHTTGNCASYFCLAFFDFNKRVMFPNELWKVIVLEFVDFLDIAKIIVLSKFFNSLVLGDPKNLDYIFQRCIRNRGLCYNIFHFREIEPTVSAYKSILKCNSYRLVPKVCVLPYKTESRVKYIRDRLPIQGS